MGAEGFEDEGAELGASRGVEVVEELTAHARLPEARDVAGDTLEGSVALGLGLEEAADVVGHLHELLGVHWPSRTTGR